MTPHYNLIIATPGHSMEAEYVKCLVETIDYLTREEVSFKFLSEYASNVFNAREATACGSLYLNPSSNEIGTGSFTYDKLLWIDSDMSWTTEDILKICESEYDITSGVYFNAEGAVMIQTIDGGTLLREQVRNLRDPFEINAAGFGFICFKQGVFESIGRPWFTPVFFDIEQDGKTFSVPYGEDFSLCFKAKEAGYKIFLDPTITLGHNKKVMLRI